MEIKSNVSEWLSADEIAAQQTKLVKSFHGRDTASLNATEQSILEVYLTQGRKHGISVVLTKKTSPHDDDTNSLISIVSV